jgi:hypothetical protein
MSEHRWFYWCNACRCDHEAGAVRACNPIAEPPPELVSAVESGPCSYKRGRIVKVVERYAEPTPPYMIGKE